MPSDFTVYVVSLPRYRHVLAFAELASALLQGLDELGFQTRFTQDPATIEGRVIVLAPHLIPRSGWRPPADAILYNFEQASDASEWFSPVYLDLLRTHEVWDYARANVDYLSAHGVAARLVPVGYASCLTGIPAEPEDIDVLAYGAMSERRVAVLDQLRDRGVKVRRLFNVYGGRRDRYIARARIVLNIHTWGACLFEIVRVSYLLANGRFVISEEGTDPALEAPYRDAVAFAPYDRLVETTIAMLAEPDTRARRAAAGFELFKARPEREFLRAVIGTRS